MYLLLLIPILTLTAVPASATELTGTVTSVSEGDRMTLTQNGRRRTIRLRGIDCPKGEHAFATEAKDATVQFTKGQTVTVTAYGRNRYGWIIGDVTLPDGRILNHELLRMGLATWNDRSGEDQQLSDLQAHARLLGRGMWSNTQSVRHPDYRINPTFPPPAAPFPPSRTHQSPQPNSTPSTAGGSWGWLPNSNVLSSRGINIPPPIYSLAMLFVAVCLAYYVARKR